MSRILRRPQAELDLLEIAIYIGQDDADASDRFIDRMTEQLALLASHPDMGRLRPEIAPRIRSFPVGRFVVFYEPLPDGIDVIRVLSGARDIDALF
jgi:toxin ParE1/3/4